MKYREEVSGFVNRWMIRGTLTTCGPMHIGDGHALDLGTRSKPANKETNRGEGEHDTATVCTDCRGRAYIPGSAIKGALRARAVAISGGELAREWRSLLGSEDPAASDAEGGKLEFSNAFVAKSAPLPVFTPRQAANPDQLVEWERAENSSRPWHWNAQRLTGVAASVAIDRRLRSARDKLLYHLEYVPANVTFDVEISGEDLTDDDAGSLLGMLEEFGPASGTGGIRLGALTGQGWGTLRWACTENRRIDATGLRDAIGMFMKGQSDSVEHCFDGKPMEPAVKKCVDGFNSAHARRDRIRDLSLTIRFPGPLLVRDPNEVQVTRGKAMGDFERPAQAIAMIDERGLPVVPAKTVHGALRAQAERILRTLGHDIPAPWDVRPVRGRAEAGQLDLASRVFGAPGWRSPVSVEPLVWQDQKSKPTYLRQELIAIDRYTGGGQGGRKYSATSVVGGRFSGRVTLNLERLEVAHADRYAVGLLALVLRDLSDGDTAIGSKRSIGYGTAHIESITVNGCPVHFADWPEAQRAIDVLHQLPVCAPGSADVPG